jgi:MGT family glycosyltransferase
MTTEKQKVMFNLAEVEPSTRLIIESDCETLDALGPSVQFLVAPQTNDEAPCVIKGTIPAGVSVPIHRHEAIESFYVLSGNVEVLSEKDGTNQWIAAGPGDFIEVPSSAKHGFRNRSQHPVVQLITVSKLAVITQTPKEFDLPIPQLPPQFHYAGPFHDDEGREPIPFPWEKLTGKPLIYASLGTLVNGLNSVYRIILEAVGEFPETQVVLSIGRNLDPEYLGPIPSNTIVVPSAPQIELLKRAALCITHGGLNTVLESLAEGVPMVAIPIGYDQPGVACRIAYHGVGEFVEIGNVTAQCLAELIAKIRSNPSYRDKAQSFQKILKETRGLDVAIPAVRATPTH